MKKFLSALQFLICVTVCALVPSARAAFDLKVTRSPSSVSIGGTISYSITVSNTSTVQVSSVQVTSAFPTDATVVAAANTFSPGNVATNAGRVSYSADVLGNGVTATFTLQLRPAKLGQFTNTVTVSTLSGGVSPVSTNVITTVAAAQADLGVAVTGIPGTNVVGDLFTYNVVVNNSGPSTATQVKVQSVLPAGVTFRSVSPSGSSSFVNNVLSLDSGTLSNGMTTNFAVTAVSQTNGDYNIVTSVFTTQNSDTTTSNNSVTNRLKVLDFVTNTVAIVSVSPMVFNYQTALFDQLVVVTNLTTNTIASVRVVLTNLVAPNQLFNATGTNSGHPYVVIPTPIRPTNTASVTLQYFTTNRTAFEAGLVAGEGPSLVPLVMPTGTFIPVTKVQPLRTRFVTANSTNYYTSVFLEFPTVASRKYFLVYGPTVDSTNRVAIYQPFVANSTRGQFVDSGPQMTGDGDRFYSVIEQP